MYFHMNNFLCCYSLVQAIKADDVMFPKIQEILFGGKKITFSKIISAFGKKSAQTTYFPHERHYTKIMNFVPVVFPKNARNSFERQACWDGVCLGSWLSCFLKPLNSKTKYVGQQVFK